MTALDTMDVRQRYDELLNHYKSDDRLQGLQKQYTALVDENGPIREIRSQFTSNGLIITLGLDSKLRTFKETGLRNRVGEYMTNSGIDGYFDYDVQSSSLVHTADYFAVKTEFLSKRR